MRRRLHSALMVAGLAVSGSMSTPDPLNAQGGDIPDQITTKPVQSGQDTPKRRVSPGDRRITLAVQDSSIDYIVNAIARQANLRAIYNNRLPAFSRKVTIRLTDATVSTAFATVLQGTGLVAKLASDGVTVMIGLTTGEAQPEKTRVDQGTITGRVVDSATGRGLSGATITIQGTRLGAVTTDKGDFTIRNVPAGDHIVTVKLFSYRPLSQSARVTADAPANIQFTLSPVPTQLSGVVTSVTGEQRKVEVGNDITAIKVEEVLQKHPVSSMSELLATRVPGLYAAPTSGQPGAPTRIRLRGISSLSASNEPVIVVDGVQVQSEAGTEGGRNGVGFGFSPLDQIDLNAVETVEVLKGPSAVALYGSDAAAGVIVITTRRGRPGPPRWTASASWGIETMPGKWPSNYFGWGHLRSNNPTQCVHSSWVTGGGCIHDSTIVYQILNDPATTVFGNGLTQEYSAGVSGGARLLNYSLTLSANRTLGLAKLPDADVQMLQTAGTQVPEWQRRPQAAAYQSGTATIGLAIGDATDLTFTTSLNRQTARTTPLGNAIAEAAKFPPGSATYGPDGELIPMGSGLLQSIRDFRARSSQEQLGSRTAVTTQTSLPYRVIARTNVGIELTSRNDVSTLANGDCMAQGTQLCENSGFFNTGQGLNLTTNIKANISTVFFQQRWLTLQTSLGGDYVKSTAKNTDAYATGLVIGATSGNQAREQAFASGRRGTITAGAYWELRVGVADRFWFPLAIRTDAGSTLGSDVHPKFPKVGFSYLLSEQPLYRRIPLLQSIPEFRVRAAYGIAGRQPGVAEKLRTYTQTAEVADGQTITTTQINSVGNATLRPERTEEVEWGFDSELAQGSRGHLSVSATWARKHTTDLLVGIPLPWSVGGLDMQTANLGDVKNTSLELNINATLNTRLVTWSPSLVLSQLRNTLVNMGRNGDGFTGHSSGGALYTRNVRGYPVFGRWTTPIVGYADRDNSGFIEKDEVIYGDSAVFVGAPYPRFTMNMQHELTFLSRFTLGGVLAYENGLTQVREPGSYERVKNDPTVSLREQAYGLYSMLTYVQTVSALRLTSLKVSYLLPRQLTQRITRSRNVLIALQGTNLGLWTNYRGKDPNVGAIGEGVEDSGQLPTPRVWGLSMRIN